MPISQRAGTFGQGMKIMVGIEQRREMLQREGVGREVHGPADGHQEGQQAIPGLRPIGLRDGTRPSSDSPPDGSSFCQTIDMLCSWVVTEALVDWQPDAGACESPKRAGGACPQPTGRRLFRRLDQSALNATRRGCDAGAQQSCKYWVKTLTNAERCGCMHTSGCTSSTPHQQDVRMKWLSLARDRAHSSDPFNRQAGRRTVRAIACTS
jgi:hypothetical protein